MVSVCLLTLHSIRIPYNLLHLIISQTVCTLAEYLALFLLNLSYRIDSQSIGISNGLLVCCICFTRASFGSFFIDRKPNFILEQLVLPEQYIKFTRNITVDEFNSIFFFLFNIVETHRRFPVLTSVLEFSICYQSYSRQLLIWNVLARQWKQIDIFIIHGYFEISGYFAGTIMRSLEPYPDISKYPLMNIYQFPLFGSGSSRRTKFASAIGENSNTFSQCLCKSCFSTLTDNGNVIILLVFDN